MEVVDENEWLPKMEQLKRGGEQEMIIKCNYSRVDQQTLSDMAYQLGLYFHAYNKGKALVLSKVPLPNYRADLDEHHRYTQKEIQMSSETERLVERLLDSSQGSEPASSSSASSAPVVKQSLASENRSKPASIMETGSAKEKLNYKLREQQEKLKATDNVKVMLSFRMKLPAFKMKEGFLKAVANNQVWFLS